MILILKKARWSITRPLLKLQMISVGVCPEWKRDPTTVEMKKERKNTYEGKGGGTRSHSFNIKFVMIPKHRSYLNMKNVKMSFDSYLFSSHHYSLI